MLSDLANDFLLPIGITQCVFYAVQVYCFSLTRAVITRHNVMNECV